jgi:hypothetical protein
LPINLTSRRPRFNLDGGGHSGSKNHLGRRLVNMDTDWDALGQAHPSEDGVDVGDALTVRLGIWNVDGASDAVDVTTKGLAVADQLDFSLISDANRSKVRFLEIGVDPKGIRVERAFAPTFR